MNNWWDSAPLAPQQPGPSEALKRLLDQGATVSNGFRYPADVERLRRAGYTPADDGAHNHGDGVDLTPGGAFKSLPALRAAAAREFGPGAKVAIHNGTHVHAEVPGWGAAPDVTRNPNIKQGAWWSGAPLAKPSNPKPALRSSTALPGMFATGQVHDGDTFRLSTGPNGRLFGVDAFELDQTGHTLAGVSISLGKQARDALGMFANPQGRVSPMGGSTYGRPVVALNNGGDAGQSLLRQGLGLAEPNYLRGSPQFGPYMEAERLARMNLLGAHGNTFQTPSAFRHGAPDPWQHPEQAKAGEPGVAVFADEPLPFAGIRPEIERAYVEFARTAKTPEELVEFGKENGFTVPLKEAGKFIEARNKAGRSGDKPQYLAPPRPSIDPGDGKFGTTMRGIGDPFNVLDEFGGIADTLGATGGRENVFNSDRRFGDIWWNNIDQNRDIIAHDNETHPYYRLGGQLASGIALPLGVARTVPRLMTLGAIEGGLAGAGAGEGGFAERFPNAALGTVVGTAGGAALGGMAAGVPIALQAGRRLLGRGAGEAGDIAPEMASVAREAAFEAAPVVDDGLQSSGPTPAARNQPSGGVTAAMAADGGDELVGPVMRHRDYIDVGNDPWVEFPDAPFGVTRGMDERLSPKEVAKLAEDVDPASVLPSGHTISIDEPSATTMPGPFDETPRLTGRIGNINLDRLEKPEEVALLIEQISNRVGGFSASARGRITHEETQTLAAELGLKPEQLLTRRQGQALNAEQLYASRALVQRSRETVARLAKRAVGGSDEDVATFRKAWLKHVALEEQIAGATAEAGRALSQFRMLARAQDAGGDAVRAYLKGAGGKESIEDAANAIVDLMEDPAKASHFMRESIKPRWRDKFNELWVNSLLSGPRTHVVNFVGNALTTLLSFPEHGLTAAIGKVTRSADRAYFGEVGARAAGLADSSIEALRNMRRAFKTGEAVDETSKIDAIHQRAIGGKVGEIIRVPTRALTAADEFWKTLLTSAELRQLAYRQAMREVGGGEAFRARYESLLRSPPEEMDKAAHAAARYYTFQRELGPAGRGIQQVSNNWVGGKLILPFVRTPINLLKFAGERSAFGLAMPEVRQALRAGGRARDEALAKITLGSGLSTAAVVAGMEGRITGSGPTDPRERASLLQSGWQPNSIRIGDRYVSYARFDPVSTLIGVAADFAEAGKWATRREADAIALNLAQGIAKNITNKTWLSGLSDAFDVLSDPERYGRSYVQRLAASAAVPAAFSQTAQAIDPNLRDARTIMDAIKARVPVLSQSVPVRRNVWGEPVSSGDAVGPDILSPFYGTRVNTAPLNQEIARLRAPVSLPPRHLTIEGTRVDLTAQQYDEYVQLAGLPAKKYLEQQLGTPAWRGMSDIERTEFVKDALKDFRETAREALLELHPELGGAKPQSAANDPWAEFESVSR